MRRSVHVTSLRTPSNRRLRDTFRTKIQLRRACRVCCGTSMVPEARLQLVRFPRPLNIVPRILPDHIVIMSYRRLPRSRRCCNDGGRCGRRLFCCRSLRSREVDRNQCRRKTRRCDKGKLHTTRLFRRYLYNQPPGRRRPTTRQVGSSRCYLLHLWDPFRCPDRIGW